MKVIKLSQKEIDNLEKYNVPDEVSNTEGAIYKLKLGRKEIDKQDLLLKKLYLKQDRVIEDEEYGLIFTNEISNKYNTISKLNDYEQIFNLEELVIPRHQVDVRGEIVGFTVPEVKNSKSLQILMRDTKTPFSKKIEYLKQIGELLRKIEKINKLGLNFFIHDIHESNFLVDENEKIKVIDLDSATFSKDIALSSKYLSTDDKIRRYDIYKFNKYGIPYPGENAELYCYTVMILNTLYNGDITKLTTEEFYNYISYLIEIGLDFKFVDTLAQIYRDGNNINPMDYLDEITDNQMGRAQKSVYQYIRKNG